MVNMCKWCMIVFVSVLFASCLRTRKLGQQLNTDFLVSELWRLDTCGRSSLVDTLLEWNGTEHQDFSIADAYKWFGKPRHIQYQNGRTVLSYYLGGHPDNLSCSLGELFCVSYKKGRFDGFFIFFIGEDGDSLDFWYSNQPDSVSVRSATTNKFYLSIPH